MSLRGEWLARGARCAARAARWPRPSERFSAHGGPSGVRACTVTGPFRTARWSRGRVTCPLPTDRWANSSHSLIMSVIRLVQRPRSAVRAVWVRGVRGKASCEYGRIACSRRRNSCSTWCVASSERSPRLLARNFRLDEASGSSGRNSLWHWSFCAVIWPHFAILNKLVSLWSLLTSRSECQNAHIVPEWAAWMTRA